jgi:hypothetical protein
MRSLLVCACAVAACLSVSAPSGAATRSDAGLRRSDAIELVDGGCGPAFFRAANGYCYRKPAYAPPPVYAPGYYGRGPAYAPGYYGRGCVPGFHPTPYGCRPNW